MKQNKLKLLGFIIPVYNLGSFLSRCLDSIYGQEINTDIFDVIIIDDGSKDNSREVIDSYANKYPNIVAVHQPNSGVSVARNRGISECKSEFFAFLDADDELYDGSLKKVIDFINSNPDQDVTYFCSYIKKSDVEGICSINEWKGKYQEGRKYNGMDLLRNNSFLNGGCVWGCVYRHSFITGNDLGFAEGIITNEDSIFNYRLLSKFPSVRFADIPFYVVTEREGSASRSDSIERVAAYVKNIDNALKLYKESRNRFEREIADACLYNTISAATNMYAKIGGRDWRYMYNLLKISSLKRISVPWFPLNQRVKIALINYCFRAYFKLLSRNWADSID